MNQSIFSEEPDKKEVSFVMRGCLTSKHKILWTVLDADLDGFYVACGFYVVSII